MARPLVCGGGYLWGRSARRRGQGAHLAEAAGLTTPGVADLQQRHPPTSWQPQWAAQLRAVLEAAVTEGGPTRRQKVTCGVREIDQEAMARPMQGAR